MPTTERRNWTRLTLCLLLLASAPTASGCAKHGKLKIVASIRDCPQPVGFSVQPLQQEVGSDISLIGQNSDAGAQTATFRWTQSPLRGHFTDASSADSSFTCTSVGTTEITLEVDAGSGCNYASSTEVRCVPVQLCGNQRLDPGEACDGLLSPGGDLPRSESCAADCKSIIDRCKLCENDFCRDYHSTGTDLVALCTEDHDRQLSERCAAVVSCARNSRCAYGAGGTEACYCGSADSVSCAQGLGVDGPCRPQFEAAGNSTSASVLVNNLGNLKLPLGRAGMLLQCDREFCRTTCVPLSK